MLKILLLCLTVLVQGLVLEGLVPQEAFAATAEHGGAHHHAPDIYSIKFYLINFAIYAALIIFIAKKNLPAAWASRRKTLETSIRASREKMELIEKNHSEVRAKLAAVDQDIRQIHSNSAEETKREVEEIKISTESAIQRIEKQVQDTLSAEQRSLEKDLRRLYTEAAIKLAGEKIKSQLNSDSDKALRQKALSKMQGLI